MTGVEVVDSAGQCLNEVRALAGAGYRTEHTECEAAIELVDSLIEEGEVCDDS